MKMGKNRLTALSVTATLLIIGSWVGTAAAFNFLPSFSLTSNGTTTLCAKVNHDGTYPAPCSANHAIPVAKVNVNVPPSTITATSTVYQTVAPAELPKQQTYTVAFWFIDQQTAFAASESLPVTMELQLNVSGMHSSYPASSPTNAFSTAAYEAATFDSMGYRSFEIALKTVPANTLNFTITTSGFGSFTFTAPFAPAPSSSSLAPSYAAVSSSVVCYYWEYAN